MLQPFQPFMSSFGRLMPLLTVIVSALALYQIYNAIMFAMQHEYAFAVFHLVFGFAGFVLARALWTHRRTFATRGP